MKTTVIIVSISFCVIIMQSCGVQKELYSDDVYSVKETDADRETAFASHDSDTTYSVIESESIYPHDFSVSEHLRNEYLFTWGTRYFTYYTYSGSYNYAYRWYSDYAGRKTYLDQGFAALNPFMTYYGWGGYRFFDQWNYTGAVPTPTVSISAEKGNYVPGSITSNGLYLRGPRGSISGIAGVTSRGSSSYKLATTSNVPSTGRTPVNTTVNVPARNTTPVASKKPEVKPVVNNNSSVNRPVRREPNQSVRRPNSGMDRPINRGNTAPSRGTNSPQGGSVRGGSSSTRTNGRP
jgi:hypothetical protein